MKLHFKLFLVFLVFLPTQLSYFFWPDYAYVSGIRVDYLAPVIYFTDLLLLCVFALFLLQEKILVKLILVNKWTALMVLIIVVNSLSSTVPEVSFFKWIKISEAVALYFYTSKLPFKHLRYLAPALCAGLLFTFFLSLAQVVTGRSLGGIFYYFGERRLSMYSPGTALMQIADRQYLRPYATFPHPNSLAGYAVVAAGIILLIGRSMKEKILSTFLALTLVILSYSQNAWVALIGAGVIAIIFKKRKMALKLFVIGIFTLSLMLCLLSYYFLQNIEMTKEVHERFELFVLAGHTLSVSWVFGLGLGTFVAHIPALSRDLETIGQSRWWLQPIHNIPLLFIVETGVFGVTVIFFALIKSLNKISNNSPRIFIFAVILLTAVFDHYWLTLHQNLLIAALAFGTIQNQWKS